MEVHPIPYAIFAQDDKVWAYSNSASLFSQVRSQNLKEVPQNFKQVFNIDDVTANSTNIAKKKINLSSIVITDVKLAS